MIVNCMQTPDADGVIMTQTEVKRDKTRHRNVASTVRTCVYRVALVLVIINGNISWNNVLEIKKLIHQFSSGLKAFRSVFMLVPG